MFTTWFPELQRVEAQPARRALWRAASLPVLKSPAYWMIAIGTQFAVRATIVAPSSSLARKYGLYGPVVRFGLLVIAAALAVSLTMWLVRRRITRNLRQELNRRGQPTCLRCGYDLTGNVSGRCSECGTVIQK